VTKVGIFRSSCFAGSMIPGVVLVFVANTRNCPISHESKLCQESILSYFDFLHISARYIVLFLCAFVSENK
jgi:hypothetical protein